MERNKHLQGVIHLIEDNYGSLDKLSAYNV